MPRISISMDSLKRDLVALLEPLASDLPELRTRPQASPDPTNESVAELIPLFAQDATVLFRRINELREMELLAFVSGVEARLSHQGFTEDSINGLAGDCSGRIHVEAQSLENRYAKTRDWNGIAWVERNAKARDFSGAFVVRVDVIKKLVFESCLKAAFTQSVIDSLLSSDIQLTITSFASQLLNISFDSPGLTQTLLIVAACAAIRHFKEICGFLDNGNVCVYCQANELCQKDTDNKVTVVQIVDAYPHNGVPPAIEECPARHLKIPRCAFRNCWRQCTMRYPGYRNNADDVEPADQKIERIMDGLVKEDVFHHRNEWSNEFYFRNELVPVVVLSV